MNEKINLVLNDLEEKKSKFPGVIDVNIRNFYEGEIKNLIKKHFFSEVSEIPELFSVLHDFSDSETNELNQHISTLKNSFKTTLNNLNDKYSRTQNDLNSIQRKINKAEKNSEDEYISKLRTDREHLERNIAEFQKIQAV